MRKKRHRQDNETEPAEQEVSADTPEEKSPSAEQEAPPSSEAEEGSREDSSAESIDRTAEDEATSGLLQKLDEAVAEANANKERYLRTVADLENYRKRAVREKEEARKQAASSLMEDLLPVLDNFQLGLKSAEMHEGGGAFAEGFRMVLKQLESTLTENGLTPIQPEGEVFDPNYHESVAHLSHDEVPEGHVIEVQRVGYRLQERLLRPASVVVSSGPPREDNSSAETSANAPTEEGTE
ncbi:MAG: nucleotide exchange factor GrpE [Verrucomicrobia bacterium]|nr:nucleotide exchange factor GrpE [Verrucomicrobiota bacterium]